MKRLPMLLVLLSALILICGALPSFAETAPAGAARAVAETFQATPAVAAPNGAANASEYALARVLLGAETCQAATAPVSAPALICFNCPPGYVHCGPFCRCCRGDL